MRQRADHRRRETATGCVLHHHHWLATDGLSDIEHRHDVRVIELAGHACLTAEPLEEHRLSGEMLVHDFDRDVSAKLRMLAPIHGSHRTFAEELLDDVAV